MARTLSDKRNDNGRTLALDGKAWRTLRAAVLREHPLCVLCRTAVASEVDHIGDDPTDNRREALQALCKPCHSRKTNADRGHHVTFGCDANGMPLDPNHPWNLEKSPATEGHKPTGYPSFSANRKDEP